MQRWDELSDARPSSVPAWDSLTDEPPLSKPEARPGIFGTLASGARNTARNVGANVDLAQLDNEELSQTVKAQQAEKKDPRLEGFLADISNWKRQQTESGNTDPGWLESIGAVGSAVLRNPAGAGLQVVEQLPNAGVALGSAYAGAKLGAAGGAAGGALFAGVGAAPGAVVGGIVGGIAGLFAANTALETGSKTLEAAASGPINPEQRGEIIQQGVTKGGVITAVDAATFGATKFITGATRRAVESATIKTLQQAGVDAVDKAAILAARQNPEITAAVQAAQASAEKAVNTLGRKITTNTAAIALETFGEGAGEYLGEYAATGQADKIDAIIEAFSSLGQSAAEVSIATALNRGQTKRLTETPSAVPPSIQPATLQAGAPAATTPAQTSGTAAPLAPTAATAPVATPAAAATAPQTYPDAPDWLTPDEIIAYTDGAQSVDEAIQRTAEVISAAPTGIIATAQAQANSIVGAIAPARIETPPTNQLGAISNEKTQGQEATQAPVLNTVPQTSALPQATGTPFTQQAAIPGSPLAPIPPIRQLTPDSAVQEIAAVTQAQTTPQPTTPVGEQIAQARRDAAPAPEEFTLTGSNRARDIGAAAGQRDAFDAPADNIGIDDTSTSETFNALPAYAQQAIGEHHMEQVTNYKRHPGLINANWERVTVPVESLRAKNSDHFDAKKQAEYAKRKIYNDGPAVLDKQGEIIDGNHRFSKALRDGQETIDVFRPVVIQPKVDNQVANNIGDTSAKLPKQAAPVDNKTQNADQQPTEAKNITTAVDITNEPDTPTADSARATTKPSSSLTIRIKRVVNGKTQTKQVNARNAMKAADSRVDRLMALLECLG